MSRRGVVVLVAAAVVLSAVTTWVASAQIRSPAEVAARTAPPAASPILVPVERQVLSTRVVTRGTGHYGSPRTLGVSPSPLKSGVRVVTGLPRAGRVVQETDVLLTISGRPAFLLRGREPAYRDLGPGMTGRDVAQLERSLARGGYGPGVVDGVYDGATGAAVARMYRAHGFAPLVADEATLADVRPVEAALVDGARAGAGVQVPSDEVLFVPRTPVRVSELLVDRESSPRDGLVTVTDLRVVVDGAVPVEQAHLVEVGTRVVVDEPTLGIEVPGRVSRVAGRPGTNGVDGFHTFFQVTVEDPPAALVGSSVRLTVPVRSTGTARLTVPVSALSLAPDGSSRVQKSTDGRTEFVPVKAGFGADGYVVVTPTSGTLVEGDQVVVGIEKQPAGG